METKLTLRLNDHVIEKAKQYAQKHKISLSKMVESYLNNVTNETVQEEEISPLVKSLSGVMHLPKEYDYKMDRAEYLSDKYK